MHSLVFQMYLLVVQALHGYTRFWLQFSNNSSQAKSYMIAMQLLQHLHVTFNLALILPQIEKLMQFENNCVGVTCIISIAAMHTMNCNQWVIYMHYS